MFKRFGPCADCGDGSYQTACTRYPMEIFILAGPAVSVALPVNSVPHFSLYLGRFLWGVVAPLRHWVGLLCFMNPRSIVAMFRPYSAGSKLVSILTAVSVDMGQS